MAGSTRLIFDFVYEQAACRKPDDGHTRSMIRPLLVTLVVAAGVTFAVAAGESTSTGSTGGVRIDLDQSSPPKASKPATKTAPAAAPSTTKKSTPDTAKPAPTKKADAKKKAEEPGKVDGMEISRGDRGFLGLKVVDYTFRLMFYNKDRKPIPADVASAVLRWPVKYQPNDDRAVLTPTGDGKVMTSEKTVRPPFVFKLHMVLLKGDGDDASAESFTIDFQQP